LVSLSPSSEFDKAKELGIRTLTKEEFKTSITYIQTEGLFEGIAEIHNFHHRTPLNVKRLSETKAFHNR
jgi:hypothetical protein